MYGETFVASIRRCCSYNEYINTTVTSETELGLEIKSENYSLSSPNHVS